MSIESELAKKAVQIVQSAPGNKYRVGSIVFGVVLIAGVLFAVYYGWQRISETEEKLQKAFMLTQEQAKDANYLQNALKENKQNAEMLAAAVQKAQAGQVQPVVHFTVQSPTVQDAAQQVTERIIAQDKTLPAAALSPTDRTLIVPQEVKQPNGTKEWQVGVYKVNNYRNWDVSLGLGKHGDDIYAPIGLQRNFDKDAAARFEYHVGGKENGYEMSYTRKVNNLFYFF